REVGLTESEKSDGTLVTVTLAVPLTPPLVAFTVKGPPPVEPAVNNPDRLMVPPPLTDQANVGCGLLGLPNWSRPVAVNCRVPPVATEALEGETVMVVSTGGPLVHEGNLNDAICVLQLKVPSNFRYSLV